MILLSRAWTRRLWRVIGPALCLTRAAFAEPSAPPAEAPPSVDEALAAVRADIERDTAALIRLRDRLAQTRAPQVDRLQAVQETVRQRRGELEDLRRLQADGEQALAALEAETRALTESTRRVASLFLERAREMEARAGPAEAPALAERLRPLQAALAGAAPPHGDLARTVSDLLTLAESAGRDRQSGWRRAGVALDANGIERLGDFAGVGPAAYFSAREDGPAGLVVPRFGSPVPGVMERVSTDAAAGIRELVRGGAARVPVDVTGGDAIRVAEARRPWIDRLAQGGPVLAPLLAVALAAVVLSVWKALELGRLRVRADASVAAAVASLRRGEVPAAQRVADGLHPPLRDLLQEAILHRGASRETLEELLHERVLAALPRLERNLGTLAVLGGMAPLLGLLGTVTGMIHTFQLVTLFGSGDPTRLSGGISEALVTTQVGLAIAIPVLLVHALLARRARSLAGALERAAAGLVNDLTLRRGDP